MELGNLPCYCPVDTPTKACYIRPKSTTMVKSIIVAQTENNVIGKDNQLLWRMPRDMQHFRQKTMGHHVIMGRKTFASINKPLPGRELIVISRMPHYQIAGVTVVHSVAAALKFAERAGETELFIAGGGEIYRAMLPLADKLYLTEIKTQLVGDTFFPNINPSAWEEVKCLHYPADDKHAYGCRFVEYIRRP